MLHIGISRRASSTARRANNSAPNRCTLVRSLRPYCLCFLSELHSIMSLSVDATTPRWEEIGARKREALSASIPEEWRIPADLLPPESQDDVTAWPETSGWFTEEELAITAQTASDLARQLVAGQLKSEDVTRAFCKRAAAAHQLVRRSLHLTRERPRPAAMSVADC